MERRHLQRIRSQGAPLLLRWNVKSNEAMLQIRKCDIARFDRRYKPNRQQKIGPNNHILTNHLREEMR
jgi:hypothetical protein